MEVNHSPSFTCDSPLDSLVKASVLKGTMEMVSFGRDELKILKRCGTRLDPPTRERLCRPSLVVGAHKQPCNISMDNNGSHSQTFLHPSCAQTYIA